MGTGAKRALALVVAVVLVGGAVLVRQRLDDDGGGGDGPLRLRCGTDLAAVCERLAADDDEIEVTVADEGATADELAVLESGAPEFDAWLTAAPWPAIVADDRSHAGNDAEVLGRSSDVLGRSPVTLVGAGDRVEALAASCGGTLTWSCLGDASGRPWTDVGGQAAWGTVRAGLAAPDTGAGLVPLAQAVASETGIPNWSTADLDEATPWLGQLVGPSVVEEEPVDVLLTRPGAFSIAGALEQSSAPALAERADRDRYRLLYPEPVVTADVTLTPATGAGSADDLLDRIGADRLAAALAAEGWRVPGQPPAKGVGDGPDLPADAGLPSPGALQVLRDRWEELT